MKSILSNALAAVAALGANALGGMPDMIVGPDYDDHRGRPQRSTYNPNARWRQSKESKKFHADRAVEKRNRRKLENVNRVLRGEMEFSPAHMERHGVDAHGSNWRQVLAERVIAGMGPNEIVVSPETFATFNNSAKLFIDDSEITAAQLGDFVERNVTATMTVAYNITEDGNYTEPNGKDMSKAKLMEIAAERGVTVFQSWTRQAIVDALNAPSA